MTPESDESSVSDDAGVIEVSDDRGAGGPDATTGDGDAADADSAEGDVPDEPTDPAVVEERLDDALERVAHGATVSIPSILVQNALTVAYTAVLTNGFAAAAYGVFALAARFQSIAVQLTTWFGSGLGRYVPAAESDVERDLVVTFASVLLLGVSTAFGAALFLAAPTVTELAGEGATFRAFLQVFALGTPAVVWFQTAGSLFQAFEEVVPMNVATRLTFPLAQLGVAVAGVAVFDSLLAVVVGVVAVHAVVGVAAVGWLAAKRGLRPRLRGPDARGYHRRYLAFVVPMFLTGITYTAQHLGFYPLIAWFLSGEAAGLFAVGVLVAGLARLPLTGINQFVSPVVAALNDRDHHAALGRLYHVTSRLVLVGVTGLTVPAIVYRRPVMGVFGPEFLAAADLLPGFVLASWAACAAGSVAIILSMTDHQRALLVTNVVSTLLLAAVAIPLTATYGLPGLVATYLLMLTVNNGLEIATLYHLEGLQPFTRRHAYPLVAAAPFAAVALAVGTVLPGGVGAVVGTVAGLTVYGLCLRWFGFTAAERRLAATLADRYRTAIGDWRA